MLPILSPIQTTEFILSCVGIAGSVIVIVLIFLILKPVYDSMQEDVFLKIGGNANVWGKHSERLNFSSLGVYKWFTLSQSLLKLDLLVNVEFMITMFFLMYSQSEFSGDDLKSTTFIIMAAVDVFATILIFVSSLHGYRLVIIHRLTYLFLD